MEHRATTSILTLSFAEMSLNPFPFLIWHQVVGNCKTEASANPVPMDSYMAEDMLRWRRQSAYASDDDYVFATETMRGSTLLAGQPHEASYSASSEGKWHPQEHRLAHFRHSLGTLLKANGEDNPARQGAQRSLPVRLRSDRTVDGRSA
jgi:hypothetical protein